MRGVDRMVSAVRGALERWVPWYDPEREQASQAERAQHIVRARRTLEAYRQADKLRQR